MSVRFEKGAEYKLLGERLALIFCFKCSFQFSVFTLKMGFCHWGGVGIIGHSGVSKFYFLF